MPTYRSIGDHSEAIEIDFDPQVISYGELLDLFLNSHNPCRTAFSNQYRSAIFYANDGQKALAEKAMSKAEKDRGDRLSTGLEPHTGFTLAEDYHQKYILRQNDELVGELLELYPDRESFLASTAVTRANAYLAGHGDADTFAKELGQLGLSEDSTEQLRGRFQR